MILKQRANNILKDNSATDLSPAWAASYQVVALPVGAIASASSSGTTATVKAGHGFAAADKVLVFSSGSGTFVAEALSSVTGTTLVWSSATPTISDGDLLCNLGPDTSSGASPNFDASPMKVFERADTSDAISASTVTCDSQGDYSYWTQGDGANWELVLDPNGDVVGVVPGWAGVPGRLNPCDYGCIGDNSTNNRDRMKVAVDAAANAGKTFFGPPGSFRLGDGTAASTTGRLLIPSNFKAINDPNFILVRHFGSTGSSTQAAMLTSEIFATASSSDGQAAANENIWWQGGRMTVSDAASAVGSRAMGGTMIGLYANKCTVKDIVVEEWGDNTIKGFACHVYGNDALIDNVRAYSTVTNIGGSDGIGWAAGDGGKISNCHVESPDDCYTMSAWTGPPLDEDTTNGTIINCTGVTPTARLVNIATPSTASSASSIKGITVSNVAGTASGMGVHVQHANSGSTGTIENIRFNNIVVDCSSTEGTTHRSAYVSNTTTSGITRDIAFSGCTFISSAYATAEVGTGARVVNANDVTFSDCTFDATNLGAAQTAYIQAYDSDGFSMIGSLIKLPGTASTAGLSVIQLGTGSDPCDNARIVGNHIRDLIGGGSSQAIGIDIQEGEGCVVSANCVKLSSSATVGMGTTYGIRQATDGGSGSLGKNTITGNDLGDWLALEAANHAAGDTSLSHEPINQSSYTVTDTIISDNLGFNPSGFGLVTASTTQTQVGGTLLQAGTNYITVSNEDDTVTLPYAAYGRRITLIRDAGANDLKVYPAASDNLGLNSDTPGYMLNTGSQIEATFVAVNRGLWVQVSGTALSAAS